MEATKYTELGYHGRDVDTIARDLVDVSINVLRNNITDLFKQFLNRPPSSTPSEQEEGTLEEPDLFGSYLQQLIEYRIIHLMIGTKNIANLRNGTIKDYLNMLRNGELDDRKIEVSMPEKKSSLGLSQFSDVFDAVKGSFGSSLDNSKFSMPDVANLSDHQTPLDSMLGQLNPQKYKKVEMTIKEAKVRLVELEMDKFLNSPLFIEEARKIAESDGIVFIDEIDKICGSPEKKAVQGDASGEGVQRDLLPLLEGCTINTKYGPVKTDHVLFIASGAFHQQKPSDLMSEFQGRLPVRIMLTALNTPEELYQVLTMPEFNLVRQNISLMNSEGISLVFSDAANREIANFSALCNAGNDNLGARRLIGIIEKVIDEMSFIIPDLVRMEDTEKAAQELRNIGFNTFEISRQDNRNAITITITAEDVQKKLEKSSQFKKLDVKKFMI